MTTGVDLKFMPQYFVEDSVIYPDLIKLWNYLCGQKYIKILEAGES